MRWARFALGHRRLPCCCFVSIFGLFLSLIWFTGSIPCLAIASSPSSRLRDSPSLRSGSALSLPSLHSRLRRRPRSDIHASPRKRGSPRPRPPSMAASPAPLARSLGGPGVDEAMQGFMLRRFRSSPGDPGTPLKMGNSRRRRILPQDSAVQESAQPHKTSLPRRLRLLAMTTLRLRLRSRRASLADFGCKA